MREPKQRELIEIGSEDDKEEITQPMANSYKLGGI